VVPLPGHHPPTTTPCRRYSSATLPPRAVGLIADQAKRAGYRIRVIDVGPGQAVPDAGLYADGYTGRARRVVDDDRGYLLGVTFVGPGVEDLIHSATIARGRPGSDQPPLARRPMFPFH
jgi:pyruvate/2-oxoglutarate dehydrogenase complex dihydrolipoamide dehydrogenase (E3) component